MARIIAGRFETQADADRAMEALARAGFGRSDYGCFFLSPAGQHDLQPTGGDSEHHSEGTKHAGTTAKAGTAIGGVTGLALGTAAAAAAEPGFAAAAAIAGAGVGAYVGSLAGGLAGTRQDDPDRATRDEGMTRRSGVMVTVLADGDGAEDRAIETLRAQGALEIERAVGQWTEGKWLDFDPRKAPQLV